MRDALDDSHLSPLALVSMGLIVAAALGFVGYQRLTGAERTHVAAAAAVQTRALRFEDRPDGSIAVFDAAAAQPFEVIAPQTNGFLRGTLRGLARARKLAQAGSAPPFVLTRWADGRLSLSDPETGRDISLEPFGPANTEVFKRLLTLEGKAS